MIVQLDGSACVRTAEAIRASILEAFEQDAIVELDASALVEVDLSIVQLIEAARAHAGRTGSTIRLTAPANGALADLLRRAGTLTHPTAEDIDFWCHGDQPQ